MAKIKDDIKSYTDALDDIPSDATFIDEEVENGKRHYSGNLGDFIYDPKEFQIQLVSKEADDNGPAYKMECLHYIGSETDGKKIKIPEGVTNGNFMFTGTKIESAPQLPTSIETAFHMFGNCQSLKEASISLPSSLKEAPFMFTDCHNLEHGPKVIPGTCKEASYMFANCQSLKNTPVLGNGVENLNGTFAFCSSLKKTPHLPYSAKEADDITLGCKNMDATEKDVTLKNRDKARERYIKKLEKPTFREKLAGAFSAVMQVYSMQKMGFGCVAAPIMVHQMRKNGQLGRDLGSGIAYLAMSKSPGPMTRILYQSSMKRSATVAAKKEARKQEKLEQWDRLFGDGSDFDRRTKAMAASAKRDYKNNLFMRILGMTAEERNIFKESHGNATIVKAQQDQAQSMYDSGNMNVKNKKVMAAWFKERLKEKRSYALEAKEYINNDKSLSDIDREAALEGLKTMNAINLGPLTKAIKELHVGAQLFDIRDQKDIDAMMHDITGETLFDVDAREKAGKTATASKSFTFGDYVITPQEPTIKSVPIDEGDGITKDDLVEHQNDDGSIEFRQKNIKSVILDGEVAPYPEDGFNSNAQLNAFEPFKMTIPAALIAEQYISRNDEHNTLFITNPSNPVEQLMVDETAIEGLPKDKDGKIDFNKISEMANNGETFELNVTMPYYHIGSQLGFDKIRRDVWVSTEAMKEQFAVPMPSFEEEGEDEKHAQVEISDEDSFGKAKRYPTFVVQGPSVLPEYEEVERANKHAVLLPDDDKGRKAHIDGLVDYGDGSENSKQSSSASKTMPKGVAETKENTSDYELD